MKYSQVLALNSELFDGGHIPFECFRQWFVIVMACVLLPTLVNALVNMRRFTRSFTFDMLILTLETAKVVLIGIQTFLAFTVSTYIFVLCVQCEIRALIIGAFLARTLVATGYKSCAWKVDIGFTGFMTVYLFIEVILAYCPYPTGAGCEQDPFRYGWHDRSLIYLNWLGTLAILTLFIILQCKRRKDVQARQHSETSAHSSTADDVDNFRDNSQDRFQKQITIIAIFYLLSSISEWVYIRLVYDEFKQGGLLCIDKKYLIAGDNSGSAVLFFYTIMGYAYAIVLLWVFFFIPKESGLVLEKKISAVKLADEEAAGTSLIMSDEKANEFANAMQMDEEFTRNAIGQSQSVEIDIQRETQTSNEGAGGPIGFLNYTEIEQEGRKLSTNVMSPMHSPTRAQSMIQEQNQQRFQTSPKSSSNSHNRESMKDPFGSRKGSAWARENSRKALSESFEASQACRDDY